MPLFAFTFAFNSQVPVSVFFNSHFHKMTSKDFNCDCPDSVSDILQCEVMHKQKEKSLLLNFRNTGISR